jgi:hypothetical protein
VLSSAFLISFVVAELHEANAACASAGKSEANAGHRARASSKLKFVVISTLNPPELNTGEEKEK